MKTLFVMLTTAFITFSSHAQVKMVKDINLGSSSSFPYRFFNGNGSLYFQAQTATYGEELWKSDGTAAGTVMVKDIHSGSGNAQLRFLTYFNDTLYFSAYDTAYGQELWKSDGTTGGTAIVKDILTGTSFGFPKGSNPSYITNFNNALYFSASGSGSGSELWKSDGRSGGTVMVKDINGWVDEMIDVNGTLFFRGGEGTNGDELWKSDGSASGTVFVKDINPGSNGSAPIYSSPLSNVNGTLYFWASHLTYGTELWKSDGTASGTVMVKDINPGATSSLPTSTAQRLSHINGTVFFAANDGTNGEELWKSDGTGSGTVMVKDINPGSGSTGIFDITNLNGTIYFTDGSALWKSDGTASGTVQVKRFSFINYPNNLTLVNDVLYFSANDGSKGYELWKSDGTGSGTVMVKDIKPGSGSSDISYFANVDDTLYFDADDGTYGRELWKFTPCSDSTSKSVTICTGQSITVGSHTYTTNGTYKDIFTSDNGCDSVVITQLTVKDTSASSLTQTGCDSLVLNGITYTSSGIYTQTFTNTAGCDSILTLNLTIKHSSKDSLTQTSCDSFVLNGITYTSSGIYTQTFTNAAGCDSIIILNLTIKHKSTSTLAETACNSFTLNGTTYGSSGTYTQTLTNAAGCDSVLTLHLTIYPSPVKPKIIKNKDTLTCLSTGVSYQWYLNDTVINNATNNTIIAVKTGSYKVRIDSNGCMAMSDTVNVIVNSGIDDLAEKSEISVRIYPNPFSSSATVNSSKSLKNATLTIHDLCGHQVKQIEHISGQTIRLKRDNLPSGLYFIFLTQENKILAIEKLVVSD